MFHLHLLVELYHSISSPFSTETVPSPVGSIGTEMMKFLSGDAFAHELQGDNIHPGPATFTHVSAKE